MKRGRTTTKFLVLRLSTAIATLLLNSGVLANPVLDNVAAGQVSVSPQSSNMTVTQTSDKAIINWQSFNIGANESTHFAQPVNGIALNRISPQMGASQIYGHLSATGRIILVNQAGIYFGPTAHVDVAGLIASTRDISDANFLAGKYTFDQGSSYNGSIINQGQIIAANHGLVALVGQNVRNDGTIQAHLGSIALASGNKFTVDLYGDQMVNFTVEGAAPAADVDHAVTNNGSLIADGGTIIMTARTARGIVDNVVNMNGIARAQSVSEKDGVIILDAGAGTASVAGKIDVAGKEKNTQGGTVKILARNIHLEKPAAIDASGDAGGGEILIGGNYQGRGPELNAYYTRIDNGVTINADAIDSGNGGKVIVWSDYATKFSGAISARGGAESGHGGFVETSGHYLDVKDAKVDLRAAHGKTGTWLLDPTDLTISTAATSGVGFSSGTYTGNANVTSSILNVTDLVSALGSADIVVQTTSGGSGSGAGDITVATPIVWSGDNSLTLTAYRNIVINERISNIGAGNLSIIADNTNTTVGTIAINAPISLPGGTLTLTAPDNASSITTGTFGSNEGSVNVKNFTLAQGQWTQTSSSNPDFNVTNDFQLANGTTFIRNMGTVSILGDSYNVIADVFGLQGINTQDLSGKYALSQDIDASSTVNWNSGAGFQPIGEFTGLIATSTPFAGVFDGQNHVIDSLTINRPTLGFAGLFAYSYEPTGANIIRNVGLTNVDIFSGGTGLNGLGAFAGEFLNGTISNVFVTGSVTQVPGAGCGQCGVGGIIGTMGETVPFTAFLVDSYNSATVTGTAPFSTGGLVGYNAGHISSSYNAGSVSGEEAGGIAGELDYQGSIADSYSIGSVTGSSIAGGLVGSAFNGTIDRSYASGAVSGGAPGGFIGALASTVVTDSYWDTDTTGQANAQSGGAVTGATGLTTAQSLVQNNYSGWDFNNTWFNVSYNSDTTHAYTRPMLRSEFSTTIRNGHQLQLIAMDGSQNFTLANDIDLGSSVLNPADIWGTDLSGGNGFLSLGTFLGDSSHFSGVLDGAGHIIDGLYIKYNTSTSPANTNASLFGLMDTGSIVKNIGLTNVDIHATLQNSGASPFVFWLNGTLQNAFATGSIDASGFSVGAPPSSNQTIVGGLVSGVLGGDVINSYSTVDLTVTGSDLDIEYEVGGLAGRGILGGSVTKSYSTGNITVTGNAGSVYDIGGFVGKNDGAVTYSNNFWNTDSTNLVNAVDNSANGVNGSNVSGVTGQNTSQLMTKTTFTNAGWDFASDWGIIDGRTYPFLQAIYTGISGTAPSGSTVEIVRNGTPLATPTTTEVGGFFYNVARSIAIPADSAILAYLSAGGVKSNQVTVQGTQGNSIDFLLSADKISVGDTTTLQSISNSKLSLAVGNLFLSNSNLLFGGAGADLLLTNASSLTFNPTSQTNYTIDGTISEDSGVTASAVFSGASRTTTISNNVGLTTTGSQLYSGDLVLGGDTTLQASGITIAGDIDGAYNLTLPSATSVNGNIGSTTPLASLTTNASFTLGGANGMVINTTGNQDYNSPIVFAVSRDLSSTNGDITFASTINEFSIAPLGSDTTVTASNGTITFGGAIGGIIPLDSLAATANLININADITTDGNQTFNAPVTLGNSTTLTSNGGGITFASTLDGLLKSAIISAVVGTVEFDGAVGSINPLDVLSISSNTININGNMTTTGNQTYGGLVFLQTGAPIFDAGSGDIEFDNKLDVSGTGTGFSVNTSGNAIFGGNIGDSNTLDSFDITASQINLNNDLFTKTVGNQLYTGPVVLAGIIDTETELTSFTGDITLVNTLTNNPSKHLRVTAAGNVIFGDAVGSNSNPLAELLVTGNTIEINGDVTTSGNQSYTGDVNINTNTAGFDALGSGDITFDNKVDATGAGTALSVNTNSGSVTFNDNVGDSGNLDTLLVSSSLTNINANVTAALLGFDSDVTVTNNPTLTADDFAITGNIQGNSATNLTLNVSDSALIGGSINSTVNNLNLSGGGVIDFLNSSSLSGFAGGVVVSSGSTLSINNLTSSNAALTLNDARLLSSGTSQFGGAITLNAFSTIETTSSGDSLTLSGAMNGSSALTLTGPGAINLTSNLGLVTPLTSLTSDAGSLTFGGSSVNTVGNQSYDSFVTLGASTAFSSTSGDIAFLDGMDGASHDLTLTAAQISLGGALSNLNNVNAVGTSGNNSLSLSTNDAQQWTIDNADQGSIANISGVNSFGFLNIQNLTGGSGDDNFIFNGGTLSGSISGGSGSNNEITVATGDPNWIVNGANAGSISSTLGGFTNIQNLTGGTGTSTFNLVGSGSISGTIDGGNTTSVNTIDVSGYTNPVTITLSLPLSGIDFDSGTIKNSSQVNIASFTQIQQANGAVGVNNVLVVPNKTNITITYTNPPTNTSGFINDPFFFNNMNISFNPNPPAPAPTPAPAPPPPTIDVAKIITPFNNNNNPGSGGTDDGSGSVTVGTGDPEGVWQNVVETSITQILDHEQVVDEKQTQQRSFGCFSE